MFYNIYVEYCINQPMDHMIKDHIKIFKKIIFSKKHDNMYEDRIICLNICSTMVLNSSYKKIQIKIEMVDLIIKS